MDQAIQKIYDDLTTQLQTVVLEERDEVLRAKRSIQLATTAMLKLRTFIFANPFESPASEIQFFKSIKPKFHSLLVYWIDVFDIEINKPVGGKDIKEKYLRCNPRRLYTTTCADIRTFYCVKSSEVAAEILWEKT